MAGKAKLILPLAALLAAVTASASAHSYLPVSIEVDVNINVANASGQPRTLGPHSSVTYRNNSSYKAAVDEAVKQWNNAPTKIRFVKAKKGKPADIKIKSTYVKEGWAGRGSLPPEGRLTINEFAIGKPDRSIVQSDVIAHELGHNLGLLHNNNKCSIMYPQVGLWARCGFSDANEEVYCGPQRADANAVNRLYGWKTYRKNWAKKCPKIDLVDFDGPNYPG